jgi:hypothetical protein
MNNLLALCVVVAFGCSGGQKVGDGKGSGSGDTGDGNGSADGSGSAVVDTSPITLDECKSMLNHIMDVAVAEAPEAERPLPEKLAEAKARPLTDKDKEQCAAFDRKSYDCVMVATDVATISQCGSE